MYAFRANSTGKERAQWRHRRLALLALGWGQPSRVRTMTGIVGGRQGRAQASTALDSSVLRPTPRLPKNTNIQTYCKPSISQLKKHINRGLANYVDWAWCSAFGGRRKRRPTCRPTVPSIGARGTCYAAYSTPHNNVCYSLSPSRRGPVYIELLRIR
jgi:hypothetical protein